MSAGAKFSAGLVGIVLLCQLLASASVAEPKHGISPFGDLKYSTDFKHFDYVNPAAPKGGEIGLIGTAARTTFDSFNNFILKGDPAQGLELLFDTLMEPAGDEEDAAYGLVARSADVAPDKLSVTFVLRQEARFSDGTPVTADDVVFSFDTLKKDGHPAYRLQLADVVEARKIDSHTVQYVFKGTRTRDLPLLVASLPVLSKAYYTTYDFTKSTLTPPVGSGPYRVRDFKPGRFVVYERRPDYWARDLNVNRGRYNFDRVRYEYFRDRTAEHEGLKSGEFDLREEFTSRVWATGYDFAAVRDGRVKLVTLPDDSPSGVQGFFLNTRRSKLADWRVRKALGLVFDFPWTNRNIFYSLYTRTESYFENSPLKAMGLATPAELAVFPEGHDDIKAIAMEQPPVTPPVTDGSGRDRKLLRQAHDLLSASGWTSSRQGLEKPGDGLLKNSKGETLDLEFLIADPGFERVIAPYIRNLWALGINANVRKVDAAQYERRVKSFDFDITVSRFTMRLTPGSELMNYFSSAAADQQGSRNLSGIKSTVIDALIRKVLEADTRSGLTAATHALDRVLRAGYFWVPQWYKASHTVAYWDKFDRPKIKPKYARGIIDTWWYDAAKAAKLEAKRTNK